MSGRARGNARGNRNDGLGSMHCAPIPHSLRSDSLIRTHDAINAFLLSQTSGDPWVHAIHRAPKKENPPLYAMRGEALAPCSLFVSAGGHEDNAS
jgi:hypothetical protein